jgi:hypothetical protein
MPTSLKVTRDVVPRLRLWSWNEGTKGMITGLGVARVHDWRFVLGSVSEKSPPMRILWHVLAVVNAAVWFGAGLFLTAVVGPNFFSPAVTDLVGRQNAGLIAQSVLAKYFVLQWVCAVLALVLQWRSGGGGRWARGSRWGLMAVLALVCVGGFWLQPKLVELNRQRYAAGTASAERTVLARQFGMWHGVSQVGNLMVLIGAFAHLLILAHGPQATRSCDSQKPNP